MRYIVKERYQDNWFGNQTPEPLTAEEVERLADCWGLTPDDIEEQLEIVDD